MYYYVVVIFLLPLSTNVFINVLETFSSFRANFYLYVILLKYSEYEVTFKSFAADLDIAFASNMLMKSALFQKFPRHRYGTEVILISMLIDCGNRSFRSGIFPMFLPPRPRISILPCSNLSKQNGRRRGKLRVWKRCNAFGQSHTSHTQLRVHCYRTRSQ